ncbi:hypothetical protein COT99_04100 [Candidatus Falkowbacteria bacterium CG10_big_fil_rev_8_21_14_0_10_43_10]|uniref:NADH-ubiquinone oxidoreductase 51kDa subunit iron-sulphur binding domain-containing protein n=1 Tax=Candidatus Falkowbacteria bacterium CG10_big_fil_rev_8_21_14_0_10_43_10 TaxID=1974567 RepID=A0A2H0V320_9BACT|nr:MAG: hypothetical protein COT99_04100 [Candidatus Falkowbacteria bacterium CG10_big_fil_rev_8_21_14_0_10_43_10]
MAKQEQDIISKLKKSGLKGRGGACFPTGDKWDCFRKAKAEKKYIVCNFAEGDPYMLKEAFLLKNHLAEVVDGVKIALKTFIGSTAFIYLRHDYYKKYKNAFKKEIGSLPISLVEKIGGYLAGEETCALEVIEGKKAEPRLRPPYPAQSGLWGFPTLINNAETFYCISRITQEKYKNERLYCLSGYVKDKGAHELKERMTIREILWQTGNLSKDNDFFVQVGGFLGEFLLPAELDCLLCGLGSVVVFNSRTTDLIKLVKEKLKFVMQENCDKCTPCREGTYRLYENLNQGVIDEKLAEDIFLALRETSFCPLGRAAGSCLESLLRINKFYNGINNGL